MEITSPIFGNSMTHLEALDIVLHYDPATSTGEEDLIFEDALWIISNY